MFVQGAMDVIEDKQKTKAVLLQELDTLRERVSGLKQAVEEWSKTFDATPYLVFVQDKDFRFIKVNKSVCDLLKVKPEDLIGKKCYEVLHKSDKPWPNCPMAKALKDKRPHTQEVYDPNIGIPLLITTSPIFDKNGELTSIVHIATDITERKQAEEALRESENSYRAVVENAVEGIVVVQGKTLQFVNPAIVFMIGYSKQELLTRPFIEFIHPDHREWAMGIHIKRLKGEEVPPIYELKAIDKKGNTRWIENNGILINWGNKPATLNFLRDITDRKKAEQAIWASESEKKSILNAISDQLLFHDTDLAIRWCNEAAAISMGRTQRELIGCYCYELWHGRSEPCEQCPVLRAIETRSHTEGIITTPDGKWWEVIGEPVRDRDGKIKGAIEIARDITERKRAEEALQKAHNELEQRVQERTAELLKANEQLTLAKQSLQESEEKYRILVESAGEFIITINENGVFLFMNEMSAKWLGGKPEDYVGKTMWDLFPKEIADQQVASVREVINAEQGMNHVVLTELQGQPRWYNTTIEPLRDGSGKVTAALVIARDIHTLKQAEEELDRYRERMARAEQLASLGTLSATVAHELTQPLTVISLSIENALAKLEATSSPETVTKRLKDSLTEVSNITSIVERFRNFARRSSEEIVSEIDLKAIAKRIVKLLNENARRARIALNLNGMDKLSLVYSTEKDMEQLFFALADNAVQAADGKKSRELIISGAVKNEHIELSFSDNCGGIALENIDKIFEPFFTTKPKGQGTGLGLCIVQSIVSRAGGKIRVENKFGEGSTFFVTLPTNKSTRS